MLGWCFGLVIVGQSETIEQQICSASVLFSALTAPVGTSGKNEVKLSQMVK